MALSEAFLQWEQQTKENSKQDGKQEERQAIALRMLQQGLAVEVISQFTGMSISELERFANEELQQLQ
jgi:predicted transposase YdaD